MDTENGNKFFAENSSEENGNRYSRFVNSGRNDYQGGRRETRPRFVKVDYNNKPQGNRYERASQAQGNVEHRYGSQERTYGGQQRYQERPSYNQNRGYNQERQQYNSNGGYQNRTYGQSNYGGQRPYNQNAQPRFYRERVQGQNGEQQEGGYQRPYRPRVNEGGYRQNQYGQNRPYNNNGGFKKPVQKKAVSSKKRIEYSDVFHDPNEDIRLNKYLANAGVCSRREADDFIRAGVVKVNGQTVTELGTKVKRGDNVLFHDQLVNIERKIYILLNKPKDCVTTVDDPQERKTVMDYIKGACKERVYPVGRLDRNTTGVLLLTNDGEMATRLTHPKFLKKKIYHVRLDKNVSADDMQALLDGVNIGDGGPARADEVSYVNDDKSQVGIEIHSGRNRVVRRMFDALGYRVTKLDRVQFAGLTKKRLRRGDWRFLTEKEVNMLRMGSYE
ncbi:MAG: RNA-binding S4 domain-containing protein [Bacteroidaceae bacterium]|nr:RNA-binding S4 domain-containing protein [Bacteroidaceae bacterium]